MGNPNTPGLSAYYKFRRAAYRYEQAIKTAVDRTLVMVMTQGLGANLTNDEKRAHLADLKREHLIQVCTQEILPPER